MDTKNLYLVRHGQSIYNLENRFTGWKDVELTELGQKQAEEAGNMLRAIQFDIAFVSVLKRAKAGDFRVQDDFGGSVEPYFANIDEIALAEKAFNACEPRPVYGRADIIRDNSNQLALAELELIEPEGWLRMMPKAAKKFAKAVANYILN